MLTLLYPLYLLPSTGASAPDPRRLLADGGRAGHPAGRHALQAGRDEQGTVGLGRGYGNYGDVRDLIITKV